MTSPTPTIGHSAAARLRRAMRRPVRTEELFAHIGAPKTATTTLQARLRANSAAFEAAGYGVILPIHLRHRETFGGFQHFYRDNTDAPDADGFLKVMQNSGQTRVILSEEALSNDLIPSRRLASGGFDRIDQTIRFVKALDVPRTRILLTVRRQDSYLLSCYAHMVRFGGIRNKFDIWMKRHVNFGELSWTRVVAALDDAFGAENVHVVPMEMVSRQGVAAYYERCLSPLGLDLSGHIDSDEAVNHAGLTGRTLEIARRINRQKCATREEFDRRRALIDATQDFFLRTGDTPYRPDITGLTRRLSRRFAAENARLAETRFPDIAGGFVFDTSRSGPAARKTPQ